MGPYFKRGIMKLFPMIIDKLLGLISDALEYLIVGIAIAWEQVKREGNK